MKRIITLCWIILLLLSITPTVLAEDDGQLVELPELGMTFQAPVGWYVVTKDTPSDDAYYNHAQFTYNQMQMLFDKLAIQCHLTSPDLQEQISIYKFPSESIFTYKGATDHQINQTIRQLQTIYDSVDLEAMTEEVNGFLSDLYPEERELFVQTYIVSRFAFLDSKIYHHPDIKFIQGNLDIVVYDIPIEAQIYMTFISGHQITMGYINLGQDHITADQDTVMDHWMESMHINDVLPKIKKKLSLSTVAAIASSLVLIIAVIIVIVRKRRSSIHGSKKEPIHHSNDQFMDFQRMMSQRTQAKITAELDDDNADTMEGNG